MREIIVLGIGSCGINLSTSFLSLLSKEENSTSLSTRFLFIDVDPYPLDKILSHPMASSIPEDNILCGNLSSMNLYSKVLSETSEFMQNIENSLRKEYEKCDSLQAIIINHSMEGGTGSALVDQVLKSIPDDRRGMVITNSIMPSLYTKPESDGNTVISIYNSLLTLNSLVENSTITLLSDNHALWKKTEDLTTYSYGDWYNINKIVAKSLSALTSGTRHVGIQPAGLKKIAVNCIPFPRLHFFSNNYYESYDNDSNFLETSKKNVRNNRGSSLFYENEHNKIFSSFALFRGNDYASSELEEFNISPLTKKYNWIEKGIVGHVYNTIENPKETAIFNQGDYIGHYIRHLGEVFTRYFRRKNFLHWYTGHGMDEMIFTEAESNCNDLSSEYLWNDTGAWADVIDEEDFEEYKNEE